MEHNSKNTRIDQSAFETAHRSSAAVAGEIEKVIMGKRRVVNSLITALIAGGHVLIEDVPGVGKTTLASALAKATGLTYKRAQFTPDVMPSDITGFTMYNKQTAEFEYMPGMAMTNILLADEINRTSPKTQSSLLEVMEEARVTVDGKTYEVPSPFIVIATQNPIGFIGTHPLPEAQLDRFFIKIAVGYPNVEDETNIVSSRQYVNPMDSVENVASRTDILDMQNIAKNIYIDETLYKFIVELVARTRNHAMITLGASPRASLALMRLAQANAFMKNRDYVIPEDILDMYIPAINHRIVVKQEAKLKKITPEAILAEIKENVPHQIVK